MKELGKDVIERERVIETETDRDRRVSESEGK